MNSIVLISTFLGIVILFISLVKLMKIKKQSSKLTDNEFFDPRMIAERKKYLLLGIVGISITSITQVINIILK